MRFVIISCILVGCTAPVQQTYHYELYINDTLIVCKKEQLHTYGVLLEECREADSGREIEDINQATNYIRVVK